MRYDFADEHTCDPEDPDCAEALAAQQACYEASGHRCDLANHECRVVFYYDHPANRRAVADE